MQGKVRTRIGSILLSIIMLLSLLPVTALAEEGPVTSKTPAAVEVVESEDTSDVGYVAQIGSTFYTTLQAAVNEVTDGTETTITLLDDVDMGYLTKPTTDTGLVTIPAGKNIILDLAGHTISGNLITDGNTYAKAHVILNNGKLTITDSSTKHTGAIVNTYASSHGCTRVVENIEGATLDITGGTITATSGVALINLGTCSISGDNTVIQAIQQGYTGGWNNAVAGIENFPEGVLTISGGSISSASESALHAKGGQVTITGGTFTGSAAYGAMNGSPEDYVTVFGGSFSSDPTYVLDQSAYVTQNDDGIYVVQKRSVTEVTVSDGDSLLSELNTVTDTSAVHITISGNVTLKTSAELPLGSTITILSGSSLTIADGVVLTQSGFITNNGTLTVNGFLTNPLNLTNNGTITGLDLQAEDYEIKTAMDLQWLTMLFNDENHGITSVKLANNITIPEGVVFESLGRVENLTFDGQGHTISGITIRSVGGYDGLFVWLGNSVVKDLTLEDCDYSTQTGYLGGVVGQANGTTFSNVTVSGTIAAIGTSYGVAGIAASVYHSDTDATTEFIGCTVKADVGGQNAYNVGSVFGTASKSYGSIGVYNCTNTGAITAKGSMGYVFGFGNMNSSASLQIIGFDNTGTVNGAAGSICSAAGSGYTYDIEKADSKYQAIKNDKGEWTAQEGPVEIVATINGAPFTSLSNALSAAQDGDTIQLLMNVTEDAVISDGKSVTLDLNGKTLTNQAGDTITVEYGAELTVTGNGTVDNKTNGKGAVFNNGTVTLDGGTYDRTSETGESADISGDNSWYTICNHGTMTINAGVTVKNTGSFSSMIENGYYSYNSTDPRSGHVAEVNAANPQLTIYGGTFIGGLNSVKNDDGGVLVINGGTFTNTTQAAVLNWNVATITGGTFAVTAEGRNCILNGASPAASSEQDQGKLTITGGSFTSLTGIACIYNNFSDSKPTINGGTFSSDPTSYVADGYIVKRDGTSAYTYTVLVKNNLTSGIYMADPTGSTASNYYVTNNNDGTWTVYYSAPSGGGSSSSGSSGNKTETTTNPDGSTTTTVTKPDGSTTETTKQPNGSTTTVATDKNGNVETTVKLPSAVVSEAAEKGEAVALPMDSVKVSSDSDDASPITVDLPSNTSAKVEIPVADVTAGTVAILVKADGTEQVIKTTLTTENGVAVTLADGDTVKIVDNSKDFDDVEEDYWGSSYIDFATSRELFSGTSESTFSPETVMTRGMIVTVLAAYDGADTSAAAGEVWYTAGQKWAMLNGISDGTNMNGSLNREQLAVMLWSYAGKPAPTGNLSSYVDADSTSDWAADALTWAVENGLISGMDDGTLNPQGLATRAQVATIMTQFVALTA